MAAESGIEVGNFNLAHLCEENVVSTLAYAMTFSKRWSRLEFSLRFNYLDVGYH